MLTIHHFIVILLSTIFCLYADALFAATPTQAILLQKDNFEHIQFNKIRSNNHIFNNGELKIEVDDSSSFLMLPFATVKKINKMSFKWRSEGLPLVVDAAHESTRSGDDAVIKIGMLLKADESSFNPFTPSWLKRVNKLLSYPSENMVYLMANAKHAVGEQWLNAYNDRVLMVSINSVKELDGWQQASYQFNQSQEVVALWIMSDGDNTDSKFTSYIKNIQFE